ncbi:hypothetical protein J7384_17710 [Endozoicomonas sp. G2_1]|uniref:hypothetical protein n=1 Tax=Endozoicomonas sp. G2_1 TaxID=2821091 RepID=UPI001ADB20FB|nr:hypothetical protein [Endozoicomonas sp. G2_1]MBO9492202.1 hypothetical protein [Endozoicomonas sp. G2_1]
MENTKRVTFDLDAQTFAWLEVLVVGLARENYAEISQEAYQERVNEIARRDKNDFGKGVNELLKEIAISLADGTRRPGSWERGSLESLTGYQGAYVPEMFADCIKQQAIDHGFELE